MGNLEYKGKKWLFDFVSKRKVKCQVVTILFCELLYHKGFFHGWTFVSFMDPQVNTLTVFNNLILPSTRRQTDSNITPIIFFLTITETRSKRTQLHIKTYEFYSKWHYQQISTIIGLLATYVEIPLAENNMQLYVFIQPLMKKSSLSAFKKSPSYCKKLTANFEQMHHSPKSKKPHPDSKALDSLLALASDETQTDSDHGCPTPWSPYTNKEKNRDKRIPEWWHDMNGWKNGWHTS